MAISKKNRRTIKYKGQNFLCWVDSDFDGIGNMLSVRIASEDMKFLIKHFAAHNNPAESHLSVIGQYFPGLGAKTGNSVKLSCPDLYTSVLGHYSR